MTMETKIKLSGSNYRTRIGDNKNNVERGEKY